MKTQNLVALDTLFYQFKKNDNLGSLGQFMKTIAGSNYALSKEQLHIVGESVIRSCRETKPGFLIKIDYLTTFAKLEFVSCKPLLIPYVDEIDQVYDVLLENDELRDIEVL
jgi:hypothetical protein